MDGGEWYRAVCSCGRWYSGLSYHPNPVRKDGKQHADALNNQEGAMATLIDSEYGTTDDGALLEQRHHYNGRLITVTIRWDKDGSPFSEARAVVLANLKETDLEINSFPSNWHTSNKRDTEQLGQNVPAWMVEIVEALIERMTTILDIMSS